MKKACLNLRPKMSRKMMLKKCFSITLKLLKYIILYLYILLSITERYVSNEGLILMLSII